MKVMDYIEAIFWKTAKVTHGNHGLCGSNILKNGRGKQLKFMESMDFVKRIH